MKYYVNDIIDGNSLTLSEYLDILLYGNYKKLYPNNCFPSNAMIEEYLKIIKNVSDEEIKKIILRFIVHEGGYGLNKFHIELLKKDRKLTKSICKNHPIYLNRLLKLGKPWEGLTWIIDLLPTFPNEVLNVIDSFFKIYCQYLPDDVMFGLSNIDQIIRAKYFEVDHPIEILYNLSPIEFEFLIAELYSKMGYEVNVTKKTHDDGIDIIAKNSDVAKKELIMIQCKRYERKNYCKGHSRNNWCS